MHTHKKSYETSPLRASSCQRTPGPTSSCPQTEVKDHPVSLGMMCVQRIESSSLCWLPKMGLLLQISNYPNSS
jgi:hypothetical protein